MLPIRGGTTGAGSTALTRRGGQGTNPHSQFRAGLVGRGLPQLLDLKDESSHLIEATLIINGLSGLAG